MNKKFVYQVGNNKKVNKICIWFIPAFSLYSNSDCPSHALRSTTWHCFRQPNSNSDVNKWRSFVVCDCDWSDTNNLFCSGPATSDQRRSFIFLPLN